MDFRENLKCLLRDRNLKQSELSRMAGIQASLMSEYLSGKKGPTIGNAVLLADALKISLDALIGREEYLPPETEEHSEIIEELIKTAKKLPEREQLYLLDVANAWKRRINGKQKEEQQEDKSADPPLL